MHLPLCLFSSVLSVHLECSQHPSAWPSRPPQTSWWSAPTAFCFIWSSSRTSRVFPWDCGLARARRGCRLAVQILQGAWFRATRGLFAFQSTSSLQPGASQFRFEGHARSFGQQRDRSDMSRWCLSHLRDLGRDWSLGLSRTARVGRVTRWDTAASFQSRNIGSCWSTSRCLLGRSSKWQCQQSACLIDYRLYKTTALFPLRWRPAMQFLAGTPMGFDLRRGPWTRSCTSWRRSLHRRRTCSPSSARPWWSRKSSIWHCRTVLSRSSPQEASSTCRRLGRTHPTLPSPWRLRTLARSISVHVLAVAMLPPRSTFRLHSSLLHWPALGRRARCYRPFEVSSSHLSTRQVSCRRVISDWPSEGRSLRLSICGPESAIQVSCCSHRPKHCRSVISAWL